MVDQHLHSPASDHRFDIYPAIDLRKGVVVRLRQGDPEQQTQYGDNPAQVADRWLSAGAPWLHIVNLDAALGETSTENQAALQSILEVSGRYGAKVQFGGGLRRFADIKDVLDIGVQRVLLGTVAVESPEIIREALDKFGPNRIAVALDARDGEVRVRGWKEGSGVRVEQLGVEMFASGIRTVIFTNIARDGVGSGADVDASVKLAEETKLNVIISGGVKSIHDVIKAKTAAERHSVASQISDLKSGRISGIIIGRALYDGSVKLEEALQC